jgi:hypothetical protein
LLNSAFALDAEEDRVLAYAAGRAVQSCCSAAEDVDAEVEEDWCREKSVSARKVVTRSSPTWNGFQRSCRGTKSTGCANVSVHPSPAFLSCAKKSTFIT